MEVIGCKWLELVENVWNNVWGWLNIFRNGRKQCNLLKICWKMARISDNNYDDLRCFSGSIALWKHHASAGLNCAARLPAASNYTFASMSLRRITWQQRRKKHRATVTSLLLLHISSQTNKCSLWYATLPLLSTIMNDGAPVEGLVLLFEPISITHTPSKNKQLNTRHDIFTWKLRITSHRSK